MIELLKGSNETVYVRPLHKWPNCAHSQSVINTDTTVVPK